MLCSRASFDLRGVGVELPEGAEAADLRFGG
jgi:hypothetical protein